MPLNLEHKLNPANARALTLQALHSSRRARRELLVVVPLLAGALIVFANRREWFANTIRAPASNGTTTSSSRRARRELCRACRVRARALAGFSLCSRFNGISS